MVIQTSSNLQDINGNTPLHFAAKQRCEDEARVKVSVARLISAGVDVTVMNKHGETPLHVAARRNNCGIMRLLINHGADSNARGRYKRTPLFFATRHVEATNVLIENGADVNARDEQGITPLLDILGKKHASIDVVRVLLSAGADANATDKRKRNSLHHAVLKRDSHDAIRLRFKAGVDVNASDEDGRTPLHLVFWKGSSFELEKEKIDMAQLLIDNGAYVDTLDKHGHTPLFTQFVDYLHRDYTSHAFMPEHFAIDDGRRELLHFMIAKGARLDVVAPVMCSSQLAEIIRLPGLVTFAHIAVFYNDADVLRTAIAHGVDLNVRSVYFGSALHMACKRNYAALAKLLYESGAHADIVS